MRDKYTSADWQNAALITIDTQNDFTLPNSPFEIAGTLEVVPNMRQVLDTFRSLRKPIIHVIRIYNPDGSNVELCRRRAIAESGKKLVIAGTKGAELVDELKPSSSSSSKVRLDTELLLKGKPQQVAVKEWIMYKPRWGAFYATPLENHLRKLNINTVVICGCNFPNCPRTTVYEASERDFRVVLIKDATSNVYERGLQELENIGVELMTSDDCIAALK
ncbi:MAG: cysteine hydrolase [Thermoproteota archaeon]|nr:cysteine hydrolase [Thermoproteota archaeon]